MRLDVLQVFRFGAVDVARQVEVEVVGLDLGQRHHARVPGDLRLPVEGVHDLVDVLSAQAVLVAVLDEGLAGIDHEDAAPARGARFVQHQDAGGDAGAVEEVRRQSDDALDVALPDDTLADRRLGAAPEQHAVGVNHRALADAREAREDVQQEGVVAVLLGRYTVLEAAIEIVGRV